MTTRNGQNEQANRVKLQDLAEIHENHEFDLDEVIELTVDYGFQAFQKGHSALVSNEKLKERFRKTSSVIA